MSVNLQKPNAKIEIFKEWSILILAWMLIISAFGGVLYYVFSGNASADWMESLADTMLTLVIGGIGAAFVYFKMAKAKSNE